MKNSHMLSKYVAVRLAKHTWQAMQCRSEKGLYPFWDTSPFLFSHDFYHNPCAQLETVLEDQAICNCLTLPHTIVVLLKQFFLLVRHGGFKFSSFRQISSCSFLYSLQENVSYSVGSIFPYQNSSRILIPHPPHRSFLAEQSPRLGCGQRISGIQ